MLISDFSRPCLSPTNFLVAFALALTPSLPVAPRIHTMILKLLQAVGESNEASYAFGPCHNNKTARINNNSQINLPIQRFDVEKGSCCLLSRLLFVLSRRTENRNRLSATQKIRVKKKRKKERNQRGFEPATYRKPKRSTRLTLVGNSDSLSSRTLALPLRHQCHSLKYISMYSHYILSTQVQSYIKSSVRRCCHF